MGKTAREWQADMPGRDREDELWHMEECQSKMKPLNERQNLEAPKKSSRRRKNTGTKEC